MASLKNLLPFYLKCRGLNYCKIHTTSRQLVDKALLSKLRKKTGFTLINCKNALELHNEDFDKAIEWLKQEAQKQGWEKATKLSGRTTFQGLIGVHIENNVGTLVEVNCETDFVSRNDIFQTLTEEVARECSTREAYNSDDVLKELLSGEQIQSIELDDGKFLSDQAALCIGKLGENIALTRGARIVAPPGTQLFGYAHPSTAENPSLIGTLGTVIAFKCQEFDSQLLRDICCHIVGVNPKSVGKEEDEKAEIKDGETLLIHQDFLTDETTTVGEVLKENNLEILDFIRFQLGETVKQED